MSLRNMLLTAKRFIINGLDPDSRTMNGLGDACEVYMRMGSREDGTENANIELRIGMTRIDLVMSPEELMKLVTTNGNAHAKKASVFNIEGIGQTCEVKGLEMPKETLEEMTKQAKGDADISYHEVKKISGRMVEQWFATHHEDLIADGWFVSSTGVDTQQRVVGIHHYTIKRYVNASNVVVEK